MGRIADKVAMVTGAASGIGRACAERFAGEGVPEDDEVVTQGC